MKYAILAGTVLMLGATAAGFAWAGHQGMGPLARGKHCGFGSRFAWLHVEFAMDRALRAADATPEQRQKVEAILEKAFAEHAKYREQHHAMKSQALEILSADVIDRTRLEELRAKHMQIAQQGSRHLVDVLAEVAEVLTPEQRQTLAAHVKKMHE